MVVVTVGAPFINNSSYDLARYRLTAGIFSRLGSASVWLGQAIATEFAVI